jgi:hypothetical protein
MSLPFSACMAVDVNALKLGGWRLVFMVHEVQSSRFATIRARHAVYRHTSRVAEYRVASSRQVAVLGDGCASELVVSWARDTRSTTSYKPVQVRKLPLQPYTCHVVAAKSRNVARALPV